MPGERTFGIVGIGNMGEALLRGVLTRDVFAVERILVSCDVPERLADIGERFGVAVTSSNASVARHADVLLVAVKPQQMSGVLSEIRGALRDGALLISVAAGVNTVGIESVLARDVPVIRVMPNTPALVGAGMSAYCRGRYATEEHAGEAHRILSAVGLAVEVSEGAMNAVTAVSGSGPAYVFYLMEAMMAGGRAMGLEAPLVRTLVEQTVYGAARLAMESREELAVLRQRVTSKGGTTEAALECLEGGNVRHIVEGAVAAAYARAHELEAFASGRGEAKERE